MMIENCVGKLSEENIECKYCPTRKICMKITKQNKATKRQQNKRVYMRHYREKLKEDG